MRRPVLYSAVFAAALAVGAPAPPAHAQRGIDSQTFRPAIDAYGIFSVERAETGKQWDIGFKLLADYAQRPLSLDIRTEMRGADGKRVFLGPSRQSILGFQATLHLGAHLSFTDWLQLAVVIPVSGVRYTDAFGHNDNQFVLEPTGFYAPLPRTNTPPPTAAPLDTRVALKARAPRIGPLGLALIAAVTIPFGDNAAFLGDSNFTFRPTGIVDITILRGFTAAINVGYVLRTKSVVVDPYDVAFGCQAGAARCPRTLVELDDELTFSAGAAYRIAKWVGIGAEVYGQIPILGVTQRDVVIDVLGGVNVFPNRSVQLSVGGGAGVVDAVRRDQFRVFAGITWIPTQGGRSVGLGGGDADGDGVPDATDQCPRQPEDKDGFQDDDGCPDPDNDADGVLDRTDQCPTEPEDKDGFQDDDGCPESDNDFDGIDDRTDQCPNEPEDKDGFRDDDGCPELDNDNDGIPDTSDACPNEPESQNGIDDEDGCPDTTGALDRVRRAPSLARVEVRR